MTRHTDMKKILITGNVGYIGPVLVQHLRKCYPAAQLVGYDSGYFAHNLSTLDLLPERSLDAQFFGDVRAAADAACSKVSMRSYISRPFPTTRWATDLRRSLRKSIAMRAFAIAKAAKSAGVKAFVFASSCSVYGFAEGGPRTETDELNPLTAYARSKIDSEKALGVDCRT
jgi:nucleoside-diphosphate-sugar epimerase